MYDEYRRPKDEKPCEFYSGNLCSGFGGSTICQSCGWDLYEHDNRRINFSSTKDAFPQESL